MIAAAIIFGYLVLSGFNYVAAYKWLCNHCDEGERGYFHLGHHKYCVHEGPAGVIALFWPLATPVLIGMFLCAIPQWREYRHERKMEQLAAEQKLLETNIKFLKENGINADVEGLI